MNRFTNTEPLLPGTLLAEACAMSLRSSPGEVAPKGLGRPRNNAIDVKRERATEVRSVPTGYTASNNLVGRVAELADAEVGRLTVISVAGRKPLELTALKPEKFFAGSTPVEARQFRTPKRTEKTARRSSVRESHAVATALRGREAFGISRKADGATSNISSWRGRVVFAPSRDLVFRGQLGQRKVRILAASTNQFQSVDSEGLSRAGEAALVRGSGVASFNISQCAERNTHNTQGRGSNSERQQERNGLYPARRYQSSCLGWTFAGRARLQLCSRVVNPSATVTFAGCAGKTGYEPAENNCQVPRPIYFP